jgi:CDP-glycerol glycerophosphotransferase
MDNKIKIKLKARKHYINNDFNIKKRVKTMKYINLKIQSNKILLESFAGSNFVGSPLAIFLKMYQQTNFTFVIVLNDEENYLRTHYKDIPEVIFVERSSDEYYKHFYTSKFLVNNVTFEYGLIKKKDQIYINSWHGTPLKKMGLDIPGSYFEACNITRNFLHTDYMIHPNNHTFNIMSKAYGIKEISKTKHIIWGYPSNDLFKMEIEDEIYFDPKLKKAHESGKKIILYAPTWRDPFTNYVKYEIVDTINRLNQKTDDNTVVFIKMHNKMAEELSNDIDFNFLIDDQYDPYINMRFVDTLITDYSSIMFDVLAQGIKLILYTPDYHAYNKERGMYIELNRNRLFETADNADKLLRKISNGVSSDTKTLSSMYAQFDDNCSAQRIIDNIIIPKENNFSDFCQRNTIVTESLKKKILIYPGGFLKNGITTAAINLINNSPEDYHFVCFEFPTNSDGRDEKYREIQDKASLVFKVGGLQYPSLRHYEADMLYKANLININDSRINDVFKWEYIRNFGHDIVFDAVIDYTGYNYSFNSILLHAPTNGSKVVHLHNDMKAEFHKKTPSGQYKHQNNLIKTFINYGKYDYLCNLTTEIAEKNNDYFKKQYDYNKSEILPNLIDYKKIQKSIAETNEEVYTKNNKFIFIGRLAVEKNVDLVILAFKDFLEDHPDSQLLILGTGEDENKLMQLAGMNLGEEIIFMGHVENPFPLLNQSDTLVLFSEHEGQPMVLLEAIALKKKIVASDNAGNKGVLENLNIKTHKINRTSIRESFENSINTPEKFHALDFSDKKYDEEVIKILSHYLNKITERRS